MSTADVIIVGGGPAGLSTALFLVDKAPRLRERILVLEKDRYPRDKVCAGAVGGRADLLLAQVGVCVEVPSTPINGVAFRAMGRTTIVREGSVGRVVRRSEFDHALARVAAARGIRIVEGCRASGVAVTDSGVRVDSDLGSFFGQAVVGADGVSSVVRRTLHFAPFRYRAEALEVDTDPVAGDLPRDLLAFDLSNRSLPGYYWDFPTLLGGKSMWCRGVYLLKRDRFRRVEIQEVLEAELNARGLRLSGHHKKRFAERGFDPGATLSKPRALLVGESAGIDPVTGEGIAQAVQYGRAAGWYLARKLAENDLAFADWSSEVNRSIIGRDLLVRSLGVKLFYGPPRSGVEHFLHQTPEFVRLGLQHFGGKRWSRAVLARAAWGAMGHTISWLAGRTPS